MTETSIFVSSFLFFFNCGFVGRSRVPTLWHAQRCRWLRGSPHSRARHRQLLSMFVTPMTNPIPIGTLLGTQMRLWLILTLNLLIPIDYSTQTELCLRYLGTFVVSQRRTFAYTGKDICTSLAYTRTAIPHLTRFYTSTQNTARHLAESVGSKTFFRAQNISRTHLNRSKTFVFPISAHQSIVLFV